jgi:hypothetical protein
MAKYVPPFRKGQELSKDQEEKPTRWAREPQREPKYPRNVNAADASLKINEDMGRLKLEEFPSLSKKPAVHTVPVKGRQTYAELAANWAEKVKENEEKARKEAEEEAERKRLENKRNEVKIIKVDKGILPKKQSDSDDDKEIDIGCHESDHSSYSDGPDNYDVEVEAEEEEEEEVEDPDAFWTQRKNRNDIY